MHMQTSWTILLFHIILGHPIALSSPVAAETCNEANLQQCARNADSLLKDSSLVFPDSQTSIDQVCRIWGELTSCIKNFTRRCLTREQRTDFDTAFQQPVTAMATLCQDKEYRKDYLRSAPCVKKVLTERNYCGNQYRFLIDHVSGSSSTMKQICCARAKFKNCILMKTPEKCDSDKKGSGTYPGRKFTEHQTNATGFALTTLDKSLAFVAHQCSLASFSEEECPGINATIRQSNRGPLRPELDAAASAEQIQSTEFQLGPRPNQPPPAQSSIITTSTTRRTTTKKSITEIEEKPKTDKLSTAGDKSEKSSANSLQNVQRYLSANLIVQCSVVLFYVTGFTL